MAKDQEHKKPDAASPAKAAAKGGHQGAKKPSQAKKHEVADDAPAGPRVPPRLMVAFDEKVRPAFATTFGVNNRLAQPRLQKIVINVNMGRLLEGTKIPPEKRSTIIDTVTKITGQKPVVVKARKSVSNFKLRAGYEAPVVVTMRRDRMWHFLDRLINLTTPRIKDFRGLGEKAFDRQGNYAMGLTEQGVFPEINMADVTFTHGMHINFVFSNSNPDKSRFVLEQLGMPFRKPDQK